MRTLQSVRFGDLEFDDRDVIKLPDGLIGLPDLTDWLLLEMDDAVPVKWFHSLNRPDFCLPVTDPGYFIDTYTVKVPQEYQKCLGTAQEESIAVLIITTIQSGGANVTGNMLAPLLIDVESRRGFQLPLQDEDLSMRQEIDYLKFGLAVNANAAENEEAGISGEKSQRAEAVPAEREKVGI